MKVDGEIGGRGFTSCSDVSVDVTARVLQSLARPRDSGGEVEARLAA
jgi:hypothetical protein